MQLDKVLKDVSTTYSIPLTDLQSRIGGKYTESDTQIEKTIEAVPLAAATTPKRRGRKKKQKDEFIEVEEYVYEGATYLVDGQNYVYSFDIDAPHLIGERFVDGTIRFFVDPSTIRGASSST